MIRYITHPYINKKKYDLCINLDQSNLIYGYSWYLDVVCQSWDALVLDDYDAVWPLPVRYKYGQKYFFRPTAVQQLGIFTKKPLRDEHWQKFAEKLIEQCALADLYLNEEQAFPVLNGVEVRKQTNYLLPLNRTYQEIYKGYSTNLRRNIRKAEKSDWQLFEHDSPEVLIKLFAENRGSEVKLPRRFFQDMKQIMFTLMHKGLGEVWTVYGGPNQVCAGAFWVKHKGRATFLFSGVNNWGREYFAMPYLINEYIIFNSEKLKTLDFEGSNQEGLGRFYRSFGSEAHTYQRLFINKLPLFIRWLKKM